MLAWFPPCYHMQSTSERTATLFMGSRAFVTSKRFLIDRCFLASAGAIFTQAIRADYRESEEITMLLVIERFFNAYA